MNYDDLIPVPSHLWHLTTCSLTNLKNFLVAQSRLRRIEENTAFDRRLEEIYDLLVHLIRPSLHYCSA